MHTCAIFLAYTELPTFAKATHSPRSTPGVNVKSEIIVSTAFLQLCRPESPSERPHLRVVLLGARWGGRVTDGMCVPSRNEFFAGYTPDAHASPP